MNITLLSGGVGGAKLARGLANLDRVTLTIIVNTGDDDTDYGLDVSPDLDTMLYALAGIEGSQGWGTRDDTFTVMDHMNQLGIDTSFRVGDRDLALKLFRTQELRRGRPLSDVRRPDPYKTQNRRHYVEGLSGLLRQSGLPR
jgi:LPPG:FO 2-phospho-L-lactate transferase